MDIQPCNYYMFLLSIPELKAQAKHFKVKVSDRPIVDIIGDIIAARNKVNRERRAIARQKAIVAALHVDKGDM